MRFALSFLLCLLYSLNYAGNTPCTATEVINNMQQFFTFSTNGANDSGFLYPPCGDYEGDDFWFKFIAPISGAVTIQTQAGSITDGAMSIYWGACNEGTLVKYGCYEDFECGDVLMPQATIEDLFPFQTYYIKFWQEGGGTGTFDLKVSDPLQQQYVLSGNAVPFDSGSEELNCIQLTTANDGQAGCGWYPIPIDFSQPFQQDVLMYFGTQDANGADGVTIVFQPNGFVPCGGQGQGIGAQGIGQSWIVEFDTWDNGGTADTPQDHVAINTNGIMNFPLFGPYPLSYNIEDGNYHTATLAWDPATFNFKVYLNDQLIFDVNYDIVNNVFFGETEITWGVTSATGGSNNLQIYCFQNITVTNRSSVTLEVDETICEGDGIFIGGGYQTESGTYVDVYTAQNGCDSTIYTTLNVASVQAIGETQIQLPCEEGTQELQLDATNSLTGDNPSFIWSANDGGVILNGKTTLTPTVSGAGTYKLTLLDLESGCSDGLTVEVIAADIPAAVAQDAVYACDNLYLNSVGSSMGDDYSYQWITSDGAFIGEDNLLSPEVGSTGTYTLVVTNVNSGCTATAEAVVTGVSVDAGVGQAFCPNDLPFTVDLEGSVEGDVLSYIWQPNTGLDDPFSLSPNATITAPITYTLTAFVESGDNLIPNGDFENGYAGFTSDYVQGTGAPGRYLVSDNPRDFFGGFAECQDHTSGNGSMLIVDGKGTLNQDIWCAEVNIQTNTQYIFESWIQNVCQHCGNNPPILQFSINGELLNSPFQVSTTNCEWQSFYAYWSSNNLSTAEICIVNQTTASNGNDFALDDLRFMQVCEITDKVSFDVDDLTTMTQDTLIDCNHPSINLNASTTSSTSTDFSYEWSTLDGNIVENANNVHPLIDASGTYIYTVTNNTSGCTSSASLLVEENTLSPAIDIATPEELTCTIMEVQLDASMSSTGSNFIYEWSTENGVFTTTTDDLTPSVNSTGTYHLLVTNTENGCTNTDEIMVSDNIQNPTIITDDPDLLTCTTDIIQLNANASGFGTDLMYEWTTADGSIVSDANTNTPTIDSLGTYNLIVTDPANGCSETTSISVEANVEPPTVEAGDTQELNCTTSFVNLNGSTDSENTNYSWSTLDGFIENGADTPNPQVNASGTYILTITDEVNGCINSDEVFISQDNNIPVADAGEPFTLDCITTNYQLDASESSTGTNISLEWTTTDGNISADATTLTPQVDAAGTYVLTITDELNECTAVSSVTIELDNNPPVLNIPETDELNCSVLATNLNVEVEQNSEDYIYDWTTSNGSIISDITANSIQVDEAGDYQVIITSLLNGCTNTSSQTVSQNNNTPTVDAGADEVLNCNTTSLNLQANTSNDPSSLSYQWQTTDGSILEGENTATPLINEDGLYTLVITDLMNQCTAADEVNVTLNNTTPIIDIAPPNQIDCTVSTINLDASQSSTGTEFLYEWTTQNGQIDEGAATNTPLVSQAGTYQLVITDTTNACTEIDTIEVEEDSTVPNAQIEPVDELNCTTTSLILDASASSQGSEFSYEWTTTNGVIDTDENTLSPQISTAGDYLLTITNLTNNCSSTESISVTQDADVPITSIVTPDVLNCTTTTLNLDASASSQGSEFSYEWTTTNGVIDADANTLSPQISTAGDYLLIITNLTNNCSSTESISITQDADLPITSIVTPDVLNCTTTTLNLDATASSQGLEFLYEWTSSNGVIDADANTLSPQISTEGDYLLTITNLTNNCISSESISVTQDAAVPLTSIAVPEVLNCEMTSINLDATASSQGSEFSYEWTSSNGVIDADETTLSPQISAAGDYLLTITNLTNNCTNSESISVTQDTDVPLTSIAIPEVLNCETTSISLDASASSQGSEFLYEWTTSSGNIVADGNSLTPLIDEDGVYNLLITNTLNSCSSTEIVEVFQDIENPDLSITPPLELNCAIQSVDLVASSNTSSDLQYEWTSLDGVLNTNNQAIVSTNTAGTYQVLLTNLANQCTAMEQVVLTQDTISPMAMIESFDILTCTNLTANLDASASSNGSTIDYTWSTPDGNILEENLLSATVNEAGIYELSVFNTQNECSASTFIEVFQDTISPESIIATPDVLTCATTDILLDGTASTNDMDIIHTWTTQDGNILSDNPNLLQIEIDAAGTYQLEVLNLENGCTDQAIVVVDQNIVIPDADAGETIELTCTNPELSLDGLNSSVGDEFTYVWSSSNGNITTGETTLNPSVNQEGTYDLLVTNTENGCINTASVFVSVNQNSPLAAITPPEILTCNITSTFLQPNASGGTDLNFEWTTSNGSVLGNANQEEIEVNEAGDYTILITDLENGCTSISSVVVNQNITPPQVDAGEGIELTCNITDFQLNASASMGQNFSYEWNTNNGNIQGDETSLTPLVDAAGWYELLVTDLENGCTQTDSVLITQNENVPIDFNAILDPPLCYGDFGTIIFQGIDGGVGPYLYSIDGGQNFFSQTDFPELQGGNYDLLIQDINGCELSSNLSIPTLDSALVETIPEVNLQIGEQYQVDVFTNIPMDDLQSVSWSPTEGLSCTDCLNPTFMGLNDAVYTLTLINENGCIAEDQIIFRVERDIDIYIPNAFSPNDDGINDIFMIFARDESVTNIKTFQIYDRWGSKLMELNNFLPNDPNFAWDGYYKTAKLNPGVYTYFAEIELINGATEIFKGDVSLVR